MLKKLFYASASILMLALAYHFGATNAQGQAGSSIVGFASDANTCYPGCVVMTPNGDVFTRQLSCAAGGGTPLTYVGNFWAGGPTPAAQQTFGQLKAQYRK